MNDAIKTHRLIIAEWATLLSVFIGCFLFLFYRMEKQSERSDALYTSFQDSMQKQTDRSDALYVALNDAMQKQTERTDHLYEMFIDLIKEGRK